MNGNKRFTYDYKTDETYTLGLFKDKGRKMYKDEVLNCLNNLHEENKELLDERNYFERKKCEYFKKYNLAHLDNIQLRQENKKLKEIKCPLCGADIGFIKGWEKNE